MSDEFVDKPFFVPQKEIDYIDSVNEELIDQILGQFVDIYKVSVEDTNDNVYGESSAKYYKAGFRVNCLIQFNEPENTLDDFGTELNSSLELYFHSLLFRFSNLSIALFSLKSTSALVGSGIPSNVSNP